MLPFFYASGHLYYAKSVHLYHQEMCGLQDVMDKDEFQAYTDKGFSLSHPAQRQVLVVVSSLA